MIVLINPKTSYYIRTLEKKPQQVTKLYEKWKLNIKPQILWPVHISMASFFILLEKQEPHDIMATEH